MNKVISIKKAITILSCLIFLLTALVPAGKLLCSFFGYSFELNCAPIYAGIHLSLSIATVVLSVIDKDRAYRNFIPSLLTLMLPLSLANIVLLAFCYETIWVYACVTIAAGCNFFLVIWSGKYCAKKTVAFVLSVILLIPIAIFGLFGVLFSDFGYVNVVQTSESPNGKYRAEVVDINQGALGGDTLVNVYENNKHFDLHMITISKKPQNVYFGDWGEFENMRIRWKDDSCLIINGKEYAIK